MVARREEVEDCSYSSATRNAVLSAIFLVTGCVASARKKMPCVTAPSAGKRMRVSGIDQSILAKPIPSVMSEP